jgi:hypothetical protein
MRYQYYQVNGTHVANSRFFCRINYAIAAQVAKDSFGGHVVEQDVRNQEQGRQAKSRNVQPLMNGDLFTGDKKQRTYQQYATGTIQYGIQLGQKVGKRW